MKVIELLAKTYKKIQAYKIEIPQPTILPQAPTAREMKRALLAFEEFLSYTRLQLLFADAHAEAVQASLNPFINFLADRWQLMKTRGSYEATYFQRYKRPLTQICVMLAHELSAIEFNRKRYHYLELLIPTININNENLSMNLNEMDDAAEEESLNKLLQVSRKSKRLPPSAILQAQRNEEFTAEAKIDAEPDKIHLHHFILDHWGNVINIRDCIGDAADGFLKHPSSLTVVLNESGRVPNFYFEKMCKRIENRVTRPLPGLVYLKVQAESLAYLTLGMSHVGIITAAELNVATPLSWEGVQVLQPEILEIISNQGDIHIQKQPRALLPVEQTRIIYHSKQAHAYYRSLMEVAKEKARAQNAYKAVLNLMELLNEGGMRGHKGGTDEMSGLSSYFGIRDFYDFTKLLSPGQFTELMSLTMPYVSVRLSTMRQLWSELLATAITQPECNFSDVELKDIKSFIGPHFDEVLVASGELKEVNSRKSSDERLLRLERPILCSEQFAKKFRDFAKEHKLVLEVIIPTMYMGSKNQQKQLEKKRDRACAILNKATRDNDLSHFFPGDKLLNSEAMAALYPPFPFYAFTQSLVSNVNELVFMLVGTGADLHKDIIFNLLGKKFLQGIINTPDKVITLCNIIDEQKTLNLGRTTVIIFLALGKDYLQKMVTEQEGRLELKKALPASIYLDFLCYKQATRPIDFGFLAPVKPVHRAVDKQRATSDVRDVRLSRRH
jgi:hypothetical protein